jgi:phospholipase C
MDVKEKIKHIVVLMLENRSFDNLLGWLYAPDNRPQRNIPPENLPTVDGLVANRFFNQRTLDSRPVFATMGVTKSPNEQPNPCPQEDYPSFLEQMFGFDPFETGQAEQPLRADMTGFLKNYARVDKKTPEKIMESFKPEQVPVLSQLAKEIAVCDRWFCSIPSETWPNRSFVHAGTSFGRLNNGDQLREHRDPAPNLTFYSGKRTVFDVLSEQSVTWKLYQYGLLDDLAMPARGSLAANPLEISDNLTPSLTSVQFWNIPKKLKLAPQIRYFKDFEKDAKEGKLPSYSFIEPRFLPGATNDQHPGPFCDMRAGEELIYRTYRALSQGPGWPNTLLIILYDEHGGCFDHVVPPNTAVPPDDSQHHFPLKGFSPFQQFGPRVPAVVVSPYIEPGTVFRAPKGQTEYDHTSVLATIRDWVFRGARPSPNRWLPSKRVEAAPTVWPVLALTTPRQAPVIKPPPRKVMATGSRGPELPLGPGGPSPSPDVSSMTSLQLGLKIEAEALQSAINQSRTGTLEDIDPDTWQKLIDETTARYVKDLKEV